MAQFYFQNLSYETLCVDRRVLTETSTVHLPSQILPDMVSSSSSLFYFLVYLFRQIKANPLPTSTERPVILSTKLSHNTDPIGGCLSDLRTVVADVLQHGPKEVLCILKGCRAAMLNYIIKDAQAPLLICPRPVWTLQK